MSTGLIAVIIMLVIVMGSVLTKRCELFLIGGSLLGAIIVYKETFLVQWVQYAQDATVENIGILLIGGFFGSLIALLQESKGSFGFSKLISKFCNTERKTLLTTFIMGILIFVDDYLNIMSIGVCMKKVYDKRKIPRETLAYFLDATGAPVCVLLPFSSWAAFLSTIFIKENSVAALNAGSAIGAYEMAIPYCIYPIVTLLIVFLFALGIMPRIGAMGKAYKRVAETGKLYSDASKKYNMEEEHSEDGNIFLFINPMGVLVAIAVITSNILLAVIAAILVCLVLYLPTKTMTFDKFYTTVIKGFCDMMPLLFLLVVTFILQKVTSDMGMTEYIIDIAKPLLSANLFPMIAFILVAVLTFTTASLWGICALVSPILFPIGEALGANTILIMAAIISGGAFGSHSCFYTDATLLASKSAGIDNIEHAVSQLPYIIIAAAATVIGYAIMGCTM